MAISPHHYRGLGKSADIVIKKAEDVLEITKSNNAPYKLTYSQICTEMGEIQGKLTTAVNGLTENSYKYENYNSKLERVNELLEEFRSMEQNDINCNK